MRASRAQNYFDALWPDVARRTACPATKPPLHGLIGQLNLMRLRAPALLAHSSAEQSRPPYIREQRA
jgi:hypothetical protein